MKRLLTLLAIVVALAVPALVWSQQPNRLTDDDVKKIWESVDSGAGKFRDSVGDKIHKITLNGETFDVQQMLKDFDSTGEKLKDDFSAGKENKTEVEIFLKKAAKIDAIVKESSAGAAVQSEWQALHDNLDKLVAAYNVSWEWNDNSPHPSRMHDRELEGLMMRIRDSSKQVSSQVKNSLKKNTAVDKPTREKVENSFKTLEKQADELSKRIKDGKAVSAEVTQILASAKSVGETLAPLNVSVEASTAWNRLKELFGDVAKEYHLPLE